MNETLTLEQQLDQAQTNLNILRGQKVHYLAENDRLKTETDYLKAVKNRCDCHFINPKKTTILIWFSRLDKNKLILRIADQKFLGLPRSDKRGEIYWKFHGLTDETDQLSSPSAVPVSEPSSPPPLPPPTNPVPEKPPFTLTSAQRQKLEELRKKHETIKSVESAPPTDSDSATVEQ
jgi:hypothetical protein